jgi:hypothetical protein
MKKVCANMVPKILSAEESTENEPDLLKSVFICDETLIFTYDLETK